MNVPLYKPLTGSLPHHQKASSEMVFQGLQSEFYSPPFKAKRASKDKAEGSLYLEELEKNYSLTNTIHPRFYNVNLIELARKQERNQQGKNINDKNDKKSEKKDGQKNDKIAKNPVCPIFEQMNLLGESQYVSKEEAKTEEKEICFTTLNEMVQNKEKQCLETNFIEKKTDSEGNKTINQYTILQQLGKYSKKILLYYLIRISRGGFGKVKLAFHRQEQRYYAIKIANKRKLRRKVVSLNSNSFTLLEKEIAIMKKLVQNLKFSRSNFCFLLFIKFSEF